MWNLNVRRAFLNEAVNQLAEAYLQAKQRARQPFRMKFMPKKSSVKMYIADSNVFGVLI